MVWVLLLSMATPNGGGVAIEKFAYHSTEDDCIKARTIFGKDGKSQTPRFRLPFAFRSKVHSTSLQNKQRPRQPRMVTRWGPRYST